MRTLLVISALAALLCGCGRTRCPQPEVTPEDVAWATGTRIAKWNLSTLTSKPVYSVGIVLLGPTNDVISAGPWVGGGKDPLSRPQEQQVCVALHGADLRLRCGGAGVSSSLDPDFKVNSWFGTSLLPVKGLLPIASDASATAFQTEEVLKSPSRKLCLRIYTEPRTPGEKKG